MVDQEALQTLLKDYKAAVKGTNITELCGEFLTDLYGYPHGFNGWHHVCQGNEKLIGQLKSDVVEGLFHEAYKVLLGADRVRSHEIGSADHAWYNITYSLDCKTNPNGSLALETSVLEYSKPSTQHFF